MAGRSSHSKATLASAAAAVARHQKVNLVGGDVGLSDVHMDSRAVTPGSLYVAIKGANVDGHNFVRPAIAAGATAVAVEEAPTIEIPYVQVGDTRAALGWLAADVHDNPSRRLGLVGITGTNGKTTVAHMLAAITEGTQRSAAVIGTVSANLDDIETSPRTTPEASDLHRMLRRLADRNEVTDVAIEVSSHAMSMGRVTGVEFDLVAFTNLSRDHLDYHRTMDAYYAAKASLFRHQWAAEGVVCIDDAWGRRLADDSSIPVTTVGTGAEADVVVTYGSDSLTGSTFALAIDDRLLEVKSSLAGKFNVANAAVALTCAYKRGLDLDLAVARLGNMAPISGRYNTLQTDRGFSVVVDYAHTPEAIASVIEETRELAAGNIIAMVGAGGDRDREKRPLMGRAVAGADLAVISTDNPRSEDPRSIAAEVIAGIPEQTHVELELDRRLAIRHALSSAVAGDVVLILGKGHETTQELADSVVAFDDSAVVREELARLTEVAT